MIDRFEGVFIKTKVYQEPDDMLFVQVSSGAKYLVLDLTNPDFGKGLFPKTREPVLEDHIIRGENGMEESEAVKYQAIVQITEKYRAAVNRACDQFIQDVADQVKESETKDDS